MNRRRDLLLALPLLALGRAAGAAVDEAAWREVAAGGCAVLLRHAQTIEGIGDPPGFRLDDCSTQRNQSAVGREQARRIGIGFERRGMGDALLVRLGAADAGRLLGRLGMD